MKYAWIATASILLSAAHPLLGQEAPAGPALQRLNAFGWLFMLASNLFVWGLAFTCIRRVLFDDDKPT